MDQLKAIAVNSYKESCEVKNGADNFFKNLDCNGDNKVSFEELRDKNIISKDLFYVFSQLDMNGDKTLDFEEITTLYYYKHVVDKDVKAYKPSRRFCKGLCGHQQGKPDVSCFLCLARSLRTSYHLCSTCYKEGKHLKHEHPERYMLNRPALDLLDQMKYILFEEHEVPYIYNFVLYVILLSPYIPEIDQINTTFILIC